MKAPILRKETLAPGISRMVLSAPEVAAHAAAGQFIILRPTENGERIPLTISDFDPKAGTVTIVYQVVGGTTLLLDSLRPGDSLPTFTGPLGRPSHIAGFQNAAVIGGGLGCAIALPTAAALHRGGWPGHRHRRVPQRPAGHPGAGNGRFLRPFSPLQR